MEKLHLQLRLTARVPVLDQDSPRVQNCFYAELVHVSEEKCMGSEKMNDERERMNE